MTKRWIGSRSPRCWLAASGRRRAAEAEPLRLGIAGLSHSHVHGILGRSGTDVRIVGIAEPNRELAERYAKRYGLDRGAALRIARGDAREGEAGGGGGLRAHRRAPRGRRGLRAAGHPRHGREAARVRRRRGARHAGPGRAAPRPPPDEPRDHVVPERPRGPGARAGGRDRRDPQGRRARRAPGAEGDRRRAGVPGLAHRPRPQRRRGAHRLRVLRGQPHDVPDGGRGAPHRDRGDAADQAGDLPARGRRGDDRARRTRAPRPSSRRPGTGRSAGRTWRSTASAGYVLAPDRSHPPPPPRRAEPRRRSLRSSPGPPRSATPSPTWPRSCGARSRSAPADPSALANNVTVARILDAARESARTGRTVRLEAVPVP